MGPSHPSRTEIERAAEVISEEMARHVNVEARGKPQGAAREDQGGAVKPDEVDSGAVGLTKEVRILAAVIDHTQLRPEASARAIEGLCDEALQMKLGAVCVNSAWIPLALSKLQGTPVTLATVCGFPLGATLAAAKQHEAGVGIAAGAREIDMVMNIGAMKSGHANVVEADIAGIVEICARQQVLVKVIIENCYLTEAEKVQACEIAQRAGADFVKTSTGFGPSGATEADIRLMREVVGNGMGVKASGGIRTLADAVRMIQAGATRIGTSAGHKIVAEAACLMNAATST
ncbi:MAG: deoxyribose-phosphate aldolase [Candidatus Acidiferrales bacterium]